MTYMVSSFGLVVQSYAKFYTEMHGVFVEVDCVERVAQRRFTRTSFKFQVSDFRFLNVDFFWNSYDTDLADEHGFFNLNELN